MRSLAWLKFGSLILSHVSRMPSEKLSTLDGALWILRTGAVTRPTRHGTTHPKRAIAVSGSGSVRHRL